MDQPTRLGRYRLYKKLAANAVLETYIARPADADTRGNELVVRRLTTRVRQSAEIVDLMRREAEVATHLVHPNIARVFEFGQTSDRECYIAAEYVWGEDLRRIAERGMTVGRFLPIEHAVAIVAHVAEALSYLHDKRDDAGNPLHLVHHDVSPSNVLVSFGGSVKLVDVGLTQVEHKAAEAVQPGRLHAKYAYMSPEQVEGQDLDHRSDLFSLGTVLFELTTRKRLFKGSDEVSTMKLVSEAAVKAPSESIPGYPPALERIVLKALARDRGQRYQRAVELRDDLQHVLEQGSSQPRAEELAEYMRGVFPDRIKELEALLGEGYAGPTGDIAAVVAARQPEPPSKPALAPKPAAAASPTRPPGPPASAAAGKKKRPAPPLPKSKVELPPLPTLRFDTPVEGESASAAVSPPALRASHPAEAEEAAPGRAPVLPEAVAPPPPPSREPPAAPPPAEPSAPAPDATTEPADEPLPAPVLVPAGELGDRSTRPLDQPAARPPAPQRPAAPAERPHESRVTTAEHTLRKDRLDAFEEAAESSGRVIRWVAFVMVLALGFVIWYGITYQWPWEGTVHTTEHPDVTPLERPSLPATIPVDVRSEPAGAAVAANGVIATQRTPGTYDLVPNQPNTLVFYMDGYVTHVLDVPIGATAPADGLSVSLDPVVQPPDWVPPPRDPNSDMPPITEWSPPRGRIHATSQPDGATILLNGTDVCRTPCEFEVAADQEQHLTAHLAGYMDTVAFPVAPPWDFENDTKYVNFELRQAPPSGRIYTYFEILSTPLGAQVTIDGEAVGHTQVNTQRRIDSLHRIQLDAPEYEPWARSFFPGPGRFELSPIMTRIPRGQSQLTLVVDTPGFEQTHIYIGPNEVGMGHIDAFDVEAGQYQLTLSNTPLPETGLARESSRVQIDLPPGVHVTEHYAWDGTQFALVSRTEGPLLVHRP